MTLFNMTLPGFETWKGIYDENLSKVWKNESQELRTVAVLVHALQGELKRIEKRVNDEVSQLQKKISQRDKLSEELKTFHLNDSPQTSIVSKTSSSSSSSRNSSTKTTPVFFNKLKNRHETTSKPSKNVTKESPDLFRNDVSITNNAEPDVILLDQTLTQNSPTLSRRAKPSMHKAIQGNKDSVTRNIFSTPKRSKVNDENMPVCTAGGDSFNLDVTYVEGWSQKDDCSIDKAEVDKPQIFKEPKMGIKPNPQPEPVIRGKARKFMNAASCRDCEKFYNGLNLPYEKKQQLIKNCSKHRYVYQPREETPPGFWNMSFPDI